MSENYYNIVCACAGIEFGLSHTSDCPDQTPLRSVDMPAMPSVMTHEPRGYDQLPTSTLHDAAIAQGKLTPDDRVPSIAGGHWIIEQHYKSGPGAWQAWHDTIECGDIDGGEDCPAYAGGPEGVDASTREGLLEQIREWELTWAEDHNFGED